jgi:hypothetical protein
MIRRSEVTRPAPVKPPDFEGWLLDLGTIADEEGLDLFIMALLYAPRACMEYLCAQPGVVQVLLARARWADYCAGYVRRQRVS